MQIGSRNYKVGQKIRIKGIVDKGEKIADRDLNGCIGRLCPKHAHIPFGTVGCYVRMRDEYGRKIDVKINLQLSEFDEIGGE